MGQALPNIVDARISKALGQPNLLIDCYDHLMGIKVTEEGHCQNYNIYVQQAQYNRLPNCE